MKKNKKILLTVGASAVLILSTFIGIRVGSFSQVEAAEIVISDTLKQTYTLGVTFDVPDGKISYEGAEYNAESITLYFPNGSAQVGESFALTIEGTYTLEYATYVNGKRITAQKTFEVINEPYSVTGDSMWSYVDSLHTQNAIVGDRGGVSVELSLNAKFEYNKPIDISDTTANTPIVTFSPYQYSNYGLTSSGLPVDEVNEIYVRLTDAYNPEIYVDWFFVDRTTDVTLTRGYPYASAGANGQDLIALDPDLNRYYNWISLKNSRLVTVDGVQYAGVFGPWGNAFGSIPSGTNIETDGTKTGNGGQISIFLDPITNRPYAEAKVKNGDGVLTKRLWLTDLDETGIHGDAIFKGFTTGEVYLSIWGEEYIGDKFRFEILDIYGTSFSELSPENNIVVDQRRPVLELTKKLPEALYTKVGERITIPEILAYDVNLKEVTSTVFYLKDTQLESLVSVQDNSFIPFKTGVYTIVYTATDYFGNIQTLELEINAVKEDVLALNVTKMTESAAGQWVTLPECTVFSKNGETKLSTYVQFGEERFEVDLSDRKIFLGYVGEYTVEYIYEDLLTTKSYSYTFNTKVSDNVTFDDFALPHYMIKNAKYTIDEINAYQYKSEKPTAQSAEIFVKEDGGAFEKLTKDYKVEASETVQFKFVCGGVETLSELLPVVDVGFGSKLKMEKYFHVKGDATLTAGDEYVTFSDTVGGTEKVEFINAIPFSTFRFAFSLQTAGTVGSISMKLTDYYDNSKTVEIHLIPRGEAITLVVNGESTEMAKSLYSTDLEFFYNAGIKSFSEKGGTVFEIQAPFTSNLVFFEFSVNDATMAFDLNIQKVGNQLISSAVRDRFAGTIVYQNVYGGANEPGTTATVYAAQGLDVLSPYYDGNMKVSVRDLENNYVTSTDGILLQGVLANRVYDFIVEGGKTYIVGYEYLDQNKQVQTGGYNIIGLSTLDPTITLENGLDSMCIVRVKTGEAVKVASYEAKNQDGTKDGLSVFIYVVAPTGEIHALTGNTFKAKYAGKYTVLYSCVDASGNFAMQSYTVIAE